MKLPLLVLAGLMAAVMVACAGKTTEIYDGTSVVGVVAEPDSDHAGGHSRTYKIHVRAGVEYYIYLTNEDGNIAGIWSTNEDGFIAEADPPVPVHTVRHTFPKSGFQTLFLKSLDPTILSPFNFKIWVP